MLARYNDAVSDAAERIIVMVEQQSAHRMQIEHRALEADDKQARLGVICGVVLGLALIGASTVIALNGSPATGSILGGSTLAAVVGVFVYGTRSRRAEREQKAEIMTGRRK